MSELNLYVGVFVFQNLNIDDFEEYYFQLEWKMANRGHPLLLPDQVIMPTEKMGLQTLTEILEAKNVLWREECIKLRGQMKEMNTKLLAVSMCPVSEGKKKLNTNLYLQTVVS